MEGAGQCIRPACCVFGHQAKSEVRRFSLALNHGGESMPSATNAKSAMLSIQIGKGGVAHPLLSRNTSFAIKRAKKLHGIQPKNLTEPISARNRPKPMCCPARLPHLHGVKPTSHMSGMVKWSQSVMPPMAYSIPVSNVMTPPFEVLPNTSQIL